MLEERESINWAKLALEAGGSALAVALASLWAYSNSARLEREKKERDDKEQFEAIHTVLGAGLYMNLVEIRALQANFLEFGQPHARTLGEKHFELDQVRTAAVLGVAYEELMALGQMVRYLNERHRVALAFRDQCVAAIAHASGRAFHKFTQADVRQLTGLLEQSKTEMLIEAQNVEPAIRRLLHRTAPHLLATFDKQLEEQTARVQAAAQSGSVGR